MNAISPCQTETIANQALFASMCGELAELGMGLARIAAQKAAQPPEPSEAPARKARAPDYMNHFMRLSRSVHQCITLCTRLAAGLPPARPPAPSLPAPSLPAARPAARAPERPPADPRRPLILRIFEEGAPGHAARRRDIEAQTDRSLAADPHATLPIDTMVAAICEKLNLQLDPARLTDPSLDALTASPPPPERPLHQGRR